MRVALKFAYDGSKFYGYARQPQLRTVEGELIKGLIKHGIIEDTNESRFRSASRTDRGVSAICNVVAFDSNYSKLSILEKLSDEFTDIIVYAIKNVNHDFNPRYAKHRQYRYNLKITNHDIGKIITVSSCFTGQHDFTNFARVEEFRDPVRTIDNIIFNLQNNFLIIDIYAQTFLWNQVRRVISALEKVGLGKLEEAQEVLDAFAQLWLTSWAPVYVPPDPVTGLPATLTSIVVRTADLQVQPAFLYNSSFYALPLNVFQPSINPFALVYFNPIFSMSPLLFPY